MNQRMSTDDGIDRLLRGLGAVEAAPGIEQRVLWAVQRRAPKQRVSKFALPAILISSRPRAIAAAGLVCFSLAVALAVHKRHETGREAAVLSQRTPAEIAGAIPIAEAQPVRRAHQVVFPASRHMRETAPPEDINNLDALAISEMNAPSKPAPPLPLTHQEELLEEAVHQGSPVAFSSLRPEVRARQMELSKAEFHDFFEPPPPAKDNE